MTAKGFLVQIQDYYGPYRKGQQREIAKYLSGRNEVFLDHLYHHCLYNYSSRWRCPPDIAVFEEFSDDAFRDAKRQIEGTSQLQIDEQAASREEQEKFFEELAAMLAKKRRYGKNA